MNESRSRRWFLGVGGAIAAAIAACKSKPGPTEPRALGAGISPYGSRSRFEKATRFFRPTTIPEEASSRTPLQDTFGIITPSSLHFERHHAGVPEIDPAVHTLTIHGLVDRPTVFTVDELKRMPSRVADSVPRVLGQWRAANGVAPARLTCSARTA